MAGFLNIFTPLSEVGGSFLQQRGAEQDAAARRAREQQGLAELVKNLGPGYGGFQRAIQMGVSPDVAVKLIDTARSNQAQQEFAQRLTTSGGKFTPDIIGYGLANGMIDPKDLPKLLGATGGNEFTDLPKPVATRLTELGITRAQWDAMSSDQRKAIPWGSTKPGPISWRTVEGPDGRQYQVPYQLDPATNTLGVAKFSPGADTTGGAPSTGLGGLPAALKVQDQKSLNAVKDIDKQIPRATEIMTNLSGIYSPTAEAEQYAKYKAPFGLLGPPDKAWADYFQLVGSMKSAIISAQTSGGSRSFQMVEYLKAHIPNEEDPPARALEKLRGFDIGQFAAIKSTLLGTPMSSSTSTIRDFTPTKPPFAIGAWQKTADGDYIVRDTNNKLFKFDPVSGSWLPTR